MQEQLDVNQVLAALQRTVANQALEIAKAEVMINNRQAIIEAQAMVIKDYEDRETSHAMAQAVSNGNS